MPHIPSRTKRWQTVAENLKVLIDTLPGTQLPSIYDLAVKWDVSYDTVRKAVRHLANQGVLSCSPGRRVSVVRDGAVDVHSDAERRFHDRLTTAILEGEYRAGAMLPKIDYFSITHRISSNTVCAVLRRLHADGLIHKSGKKWLVGRLQSVKGRPNDAPSAGAPVILVLLTESSMLTGINSSFLAPFATTFSQEIGQSGFQPLLILAQGGDLRGIPTGSDEAVRIAHSLGNRYRGTVVIGLPEHAPDLKVTMARLCRLRQPVVFFDHTNRYADYSRAAFKAGPVFHRLFTDDATSASLALHTLVERGHRVVGMPDYAARYEFAWVSGRIKLLNDCIARERLPLQIVTTQQIEKYWRFLPIFSPEEFLLEFKRQMYGSPDADVNDSELADRLIKETPSLTGLVADPRITAIIAANDDMAWAYYCWLNVAGVKVPGEMSLISFDNKAESQFLPITTVDFGFQNLGYRAAHIFINDLPVRTGRDGNLAGTCALMDRGSVGKPGRRRNCGRYTAG